MHASGRGKSRLKWVYPYWYFWPLWLLMSAVMVVISLSLQSWFYAPAIIIFTAIGLSGSREARRRR